MTLQTWCQALILVGLVLAALGGFGSYHYGNKAKQLKDEEAEARREFLVERGKPLMGGSVILVLKKQFSPNDLGHFRFRHRY